MHKAQLNNHVTSGLFSGINNLGKIPTRVHYDPGSTKGWGEPMQSLYIETWSSILLIFLSSILEIIQFTEDRK